MRRAAPRLGDGQAQQRGKQAAGGARWSLYRMPPVAHGRESTIRDNRRSIWEGVGAESSMVEMLVHKKPLD